MSDLGYQGNKALTIRDILGIRDFRYLWLGQIVSNFGDALTYLTLVLLINRISGGSTAAIAYLLIALALPQVVIGLFAGSQRFHSQFSTPEWLIVGQFLIPFQLRPFPGFGHGNGRFNHWNV